MTRRVRRWISLATAIAGTVTTLGMAPGAGAAPSLNLDPPPIAMVSEGGYHVADQGPFCVDGSRRRVGVRVCADAFDVDATRLSVVRPGDRVVIGLSKAQVVQRSRLCGTRRRCEAVVSVTALGCDDPLHTFQLRAGRTLWTVPLAPGAYELQVSIRRFRAADGRTGSTSGTLGLLVDAAAERGVVLATDDVRACGP